MWQSRNERLSFEVLQPQAVTRYKGVYRGPGYRKACGMLYSVWQQRWVWPEVLMSVLGGPRE